MAVSGRDRFGVYQVIEQVGRSSMATVYKADDGSSPGHVAIKALPEFLADDRTFQERFEREAAAVAALHHPSICTVLEHGVKGNQPYVVMDYMEGVQLTAHLGQPISVENAIQVLTPVAAALDYAHAQGVVHGDVKPSNIFLGSDGTPVLSDFGFAAILGSHPRLSITGSLLGTPDYMSPEQANGQAPGPPTDLYALAVVAYQMLTGEVPYQADTPLAVLLAHLERPVPSARERNPRLAPSLDPVLMKGLAKDPTDRYPSCSAFVGALKAAGDAPATPMPSQAATLVWEPDRGEPRVFEIETSATIGRAEGNQIVVPDTAASRRHAQVDIAGDRLTVRDLGTLNGTLVNGERIVGTVELKDGDVIGVGRSRLRVSLPRPVPAGEATVVLSTERAPDATQLFDVSQESSPGPPSAGNEPVAPTAAGYLVVGETRTPLYDTLTVGRGEGTDVRLADDRSVSRQHARVEARDDGIWVADLGSTHGTYVNEVRIAAPTRLIDGTEIRVGSSVIRFEATQPA